MLPPGQPVLIIEGAFKGMDAVVATPAEVKQLHPDAAVPTDPGQDELWVRIQVFGRDIPVGVMPAWVRPI